LEAALSRTAASRLPWSTRLDARAVWIWVLCGGLVLYLGLKGGGYDLVVRSDAGVVIWWIVLVGAAFGVLPATRLPRAGWAAIALFAAFLIWSAVAATSSLSSDDSLQEVSRLAAYLGVLLVALITYGDRRRAAAHVIGAVAVACAVIIALALLSRLRPGTFAGAATTSTLLPGTSGRLGWPLNYWNALAAMVAMEVPLLLTIAGSARRLAIQAAAAAAIPMTVLCGYLTFSRGGAIAGAVGLVAFIALAPARIPRLATVLAGAAGGAALIAGAVHRHAIEQGLAGPVARHQGATLIMAVILVCAGVGLVQIGIGLAARHGTLPRLLRISPARARVLLAVVVVAVVAVGVAVHVPSRLDHAWQQFKRPEAANLHQNALGRFGALSGNGRYTYWKVDLHAMSGHWGTGFGPGTFQLVWLPRAPFGSYVINAHSLYVETLSDVGIVGLVLLAGFFVVVVGRAVERVVRGGFESRALAAGVAAVMLAFLTSAAFDWVWQVPVLPVAFLLLAAAVLVPAPPMRVAGRTAAARDPDGPAAAGDAGGTAAARDRGGTAAAGDAADSGGGSPARPWAAGAHRWAARGALILAAVAALIAIGVPLATTTALRQSQAAAAGHDNTTALADARTALRIEPGAASAALQAALVLEQEGRVTSALADARAATADEPANWQTWLIRSRLEAEAGHPRVALASFRRAKSLNPQSPIFRS
jgi:hypothetical protein